MNTNKSESEDEWETEESGSECSISQKDKENSNTETSEEESSSYYSSSSSDYSYQSTLSADKDIVYYFRKKWVKQQYNNHPLIALVNQYKYLANPGKIKGIQQSNTNKQSLIQETNVNSQKLDDNSDFETVSYYEDIQSQIENSNSFIVYTNNREQSPSFYDAICKYEHVNLQSVNKNFKYKKPQQTQSK